MAKCLVGAPGGLAAADKAKLIPENIRNDVTLFEGTSKEVVGTYHSTLAALLGAFAAQNALGYTTAWGDGVYVSGNLPNPVGGGSTGTIEILQDFTGIVTARGSGATGTAVSIPRDQKVQFTKGTKYTINFTNNNHSFIMGIVAF